MNYQEKESTKSDLQIKRYEFLKIGHFSQNQSRDLICTATCRAAIGRYPFGFFSDQREQPVGSSRSMGEGSPERISVRRSAAAAALVRRDPASELVPERGECGTGQTAPGRILDTRRGSQLLPVATRRSCRSWGSSGEQFLKARSDSERGFRGGK